jgi:predicted nucleotide-binding protein (sugar kinase/HSP70/actin superfamily)
MKFVFCIIFSLFLICSYGQTITTSIPTVTMKEYVDMQAQLNKEWAEKFIEVQFQNVNDNVSKANAAMEKRLDGINEFRAQLKDQAGTFITRNELWGYCIAILGLVFGFINLQRKRGSDMPDKTITGQIDLKNK